MDPAAPMEEVDAAARATLPPPREVYGGVQFDYSILCSISRGRWSPLNLVYVPSLVLDLPLSAVGDTVTLPLTLAKLLRERDRIESTPATTP